MVLPTLPVCWVQILAHKMRSRARKTIMTGRLVELETLVWLYYSSMLQKVNYLLFYRSSTPSMWALFFIYPFVAVVVRHDHAHCSRLGNVRGASVLTVIIWLMNGKYYLVDLIFIEIIQPRFSNGPGEIYQHRHYCCLSMMKLQAPNSRSCCLWSADAAGP